VHNVRTMAAGVTVVVFAHDDFISVVSDDRAGEW
jgi:hypothetical protein